MPGIYIQAFSKPFLNGVETSKGVPGSNTVFWTRVPSNREVHLKRRKGSACLDCRY